MNNSARYLPWILLAVLFAAFPVIGKTIDDLRRSTFVLLRHPISVSGAFIGEERIPPGARAAIQLLREAGVPQYQVSPGVRNTYDYQRITEGAWPIRLAAPSEAEIFLATEALPKHCRRKEQRDGMVLASCR